MALLLLSFVAGFLTVLAPCVLPLLPVIVGRSVSDTDNKYKPYIITGSLAASVVLFTLLLKVSTAFIDVPPAFWTGFSGGIVLILGIVTLFPTLWDKLSLKFKLGTTSETALHKSAEKKSIWGDVLIGASLGPVFSSCSPTYFLILATVLPAQFFAGVVYLMVYAIGLSLGLLLIALLGQRFVAKVRWAADPKGKFRKVLGVLFILVGLAIIFGIDKQIEAALIDIDVFNTINLEQQILERSGME